ncbi:hypothetical protein STVA_08350 [Allostella vacuolata]|nr:hypothetical protein STVA_08350 [Stella vacuolata]
MALGLIELIGFDIRCRAPGLAGAAETRFATAGDHTVLPMLQGWSARYDGASARDDAGELLAIGQEMFAWLDEAGWATAWASAPGDRELEIRVPGTDGDAAEAALLDAPWELLAKGDQRLAGDPLRLFVVARRIGPAGALVEAPFQDVRLMFMASAPEGLVELEFEAEEAAILEATSRGGARRVDVVVEETGALEFLAERLASDEGPFEALHLSCHGGIHPKHGPILYLETPEGNADPVTAGAVIRALGETRPLLVALSGCRTAEMGAGADRRTGPRATKDGVRRDLDAARAGGGIALTASFARQLAVQVAHVLAWDGSVYDQDATAFARTFYDELGRGARVAWAAAQARRDLLQLRDTDPRKGQHWHLARIYLGPGGGGPLCAAARPRHLRRPGGDAPAFLDRHRGRSQVASRDAFVGRRRRIQAVLRAFRDGSAALVHGMGALGKSSLAARVASRFRNETVVVFDRYDAPAVLAALVAALPPLERKATEDAWREMVEADHGRLADALESLLEGPFDAAPILLIVDDLEQILEPPTPAAAATGVQGRFRPTLAAILAGFARARTRSRLLLTSRYDFRLADGRRDLAADLVRVPLAPMTDRERVKQLRAFERIVGQEAAALGARAVALCGRALAAAGGNPGLQAVLTRPILAAEFGAAEAAIGQIEHYRAHGAPPAEIERLLAEDATGDAENALVAFFRRVSFAAYRAALSADQARQLSAATLFAEGVPIPKAALAAAGAALGTEGAAAAVARLVGLGLFDDHGTIDGHAHAAANPLARPLAAPLDPADRPRLARAAFPELDTAWADADGDFPTAPRGVVAARIALAGAASPGRLEAAVRAGAAWLARREDRNAEALDLIRAAFAALPPGHAAGPAFLRLGIECAVLTGDGAFADRLCEAPVRPPRTGAPDTARAALDVRRAERMLRKGEGEKAEPLIHGARTVFTAAGDDRAAAICAGRIADILHDRGQLDEALRIRTEEEIPVYDRLGDVRERAVTMGKIADILHARGQLDEALRIRTEEELPVYDRLGDVRSRAVAMGNIADILHARGQLDEALRIRTEEEIPVYDRLGDVRSRAVTMGQIADILHARGQLDEALRIRTAEELPVYDRLGDVRSRAVTMGKIADILHDRGQLDEALRIRTEEELPVYDRLGDVRSRAVTMGKIADILHDRGQLDEALRIRAEEQLPIFDRLGDVRERAVTMGKIADILHARGQLDEALRIRTEEQLPVYDRLGDVRSRAVTMGKIADILHARGQLDEALRIRTDEQLPVYDRLGDVRSRAVTMGQIADILHARGQLDEALRIRTDEQLPIFDRLGDVRSRAVTMGRIADILHARGQLDEALRIRTAEELPVYDRLGDVRSRAVTMGKIADILHARGQLDEALRIRTEELLPIFDRLGDVRSRSVTLHRIATTLLEAGAIEDGRVQEVFDALAEAFAIARRLGLPDGVAATGGLLAQVMAMGGHRDAALEVLDEVEQAHAMLGRADGVGQVRDLRARIAGTEPDAPPASAQDAPR